VRFGSAAVLVAAALVLAACGGGPGDDEAQATAPPGTTAEQPGSSAPPPKVKGESPTASDLVGTWSRIGIAGLVRFGADGEFSIARNEPDLNEFPYASGTYEVNESTLALVGASGTACSWNVGLVAEEDPLHDELNAVVIEAGCGLSAGEAFTLVRIAP